MVRLSWVIDPVIVLFIVAFSVFLIAMTKIWFINRVTLSQAAARRAILRSMRGFRLRPSAGTLPPGGGDVDRLIRIERGRRGGRSSKWSCRYKILFLSVVIVWVYTALGLVAWVYSR